ncbi:MAG: Mur ligase domain-containing protein, partial [Fimbriimonadaceae bacterium]|nr:Mur ligase domain-containing protein [Fimbriimonadaceae bacterium]
MDRLYFIRVGGTAMGGVAAACKQAGDIVFGSEQDLYEPMKSYLSDAGVHVYPTFDSANLLSSKPTKVVVGNAVSRGNEELEVALEHRLDCVSLPQIIGEKLIGKQTSV